MKTQRLLVATGNEGKLAELRRLFADVPGLELLSLADVGEVADVVEDRDTFRGNAEKKAREIAAATGELTLADDSGLEVDALDGAPGVFSARYAGVHGDDEGNNRKLLADLADVPDERRTARFRCVLALARPSGDIVHVSDGTCEGVIAHAPRGDNGFGYDPLFLLDGGPRTLAEHSPEEKSRVSHRAAASRAMAEFLRVWASEGYGV